MVPPPRHPASSSHLVTIARDPRSLMPGLSLGVLQLLHPAIGAAVDQESTFGGEPFQRILRSVPQIWATLVLPDGAARAREIRRLHAGLGGTDWAGRSFHALDPETFWWAHACFTWGMFTTAEQFFLRPLSARAAEQLYAETVAWYASYGVSMRPVPRDYAQFRLKFDRICAQELEWTHAAAEAETTGLQSIGTAVEQIVPVVGRAAQALAPAARTMAIGYLPETVRDRFFASRWSRDQQLAADALRAAARGGVALAPRVARESVQRAMLRVLGARTRQDRFVPEPISA